MITIVQIDDEQKDIDRVATALQPLKCYLEYQLISFLSLESGLSYIRQNSVQLVLLDLEFTIGNKSAIFAIDRMDPSIPIIVVSHLSHYQRQLQLKVNVAGFVPKALIEDQLARAVMEVFSSKKLVSRPTQFTFPPARGGGIGQTFDLEESLYFKVHSFQEYDIFLANGQKTRRASLSFAELCKRIEDEKNTILQPISRNTIININYIAEVTVLRNGRVTVLLIGRSEELHVGKHYQMRFRDWYG